MTDHTSPDGAPDTEAPTWDEHAPIDDDALAAESVDALTAAEIAPQGVHVDQLFGDLEAEPADIGATSTVHTMPVFTDEQFGGDELESDDDRDQAGVVAGVGALSALRDDGSSRAGWAYLGLMALISFAMIGWAVATSGSDEAGPTTTASADPAGTAAPVELDLVVNGGTVVLQGTVPDQGAVDQLFALAEARYGEGNVTSELVADGGVTLTGGTVNVLGSAEEGDDGPNGLQSDVVAAFGLRAGGFDLTRTEAELTSVRAEALVGAGTVELSGAFPDQAAANQYILAAEQIFGAENVTAFNVTVDPDTTLNGVLFAISGLVDAGDTRATEFEQRVLAFFGGSRADSSGLQIDTSPEALARLEERLRAEVEVEPILFASGSAELDESSDAILQRIAEAINATPGVNVEIVGHTDGQGAVETNQEISERRAQAVLDRLIELGVDESRLRARGAGESEPIADNETEEGRAANRRIAFEFDGAG